MQPEARGRINTARCVTEKVGSVTSLPRPSRFDQEAFAFLSFDPARFATASRPRRPGLRISIFRCSCRFRSSGRPRATRAAEDLFGSQTVLRNACAHLLKDGLELGKSDLLCLPQKFVSLRFQFLICCHSLTSERVCVI